MRRRELLGIAGLAAVWPLTARAQQKAVPVIGYLGLTSPESSYMAPLLLAFRQGLAETGYVEGQNVAIEYRWAEGDYGHKPSAYEVKAVVRRTWSQADIGQIEIPRAAGPLDT